MIRSKTIHDAQLWCDTAYDPAVVIVGTHSNPLGASKTLQLPAKAKRSANVIAISRSGAVAWDLRNANPDVALRDVNFGTVVAVPKMDTVAVLHSGGVDDKLKSRMQGRWKDSMRPPAILFILDGATGKILKSKEMPNGLEAYTTPVFTPAGDLIVGTGGETTGGSLLRLDLANDFAELWSPITVPESVRHYSSQADSRGFFFGFFFVAVLM